jgi:mannose-6-phosphate isomerase-like protein (cupin superfamily)
VGGSRAARHFRFGGLPREQVAEHLSRSAVRSDGSLAVLNWMEPRPTARAPHDHPFDQLSFVLDGKMEFEVEGETFNVGPGEVLVIPPDAAHTARALGTETALSLDIFAPPREDYLHLAAHQAAGTDGEVAR